MLVHRCLEHVGPLPLCTTNGLGVLSYSYGHERISSLDALFPWLCRVMTLKFLDEGGVAVVGLLHLELLLVIRTGRIEMY